MRKTVIEIVFFLADVQLKHTSACVNKNDNNNDQQLPSVTSAPVQTTVSLPPHFRLCIKSCPTLEEVKQICGTNGVTYKNPSHMQCAKVCGASKYGDICTIVKQIIIYSAVSIFK